MQSGFDGLDAAAATAYLKMSLSLTTVQVEQADQVLKIEALQDDLKYKSNYLVRHQFDEKQASPATVPCCSLWLLSGSARAPLHGCRRSPCRVPLHALSPLASACMLPPAVCVCVSAACSCSCAC